MLVLLAEWFLSGSLHRTKGNDMTIKQQGGVFGRHPEFSTVEIDGVGTLKKSGSNLEIVAPSGVKISGPSFWGVDVDGGLRVHDDLFRLIRNANTSYVDIGVDATSAYLRSSFSSGGTSDLRFLHISSEIARITGNGITFNGDTAAANALDDYEEGTFTPTIIGTTTAGSGTYTLNAGHYTKVGNRVMYNIWLQWTAHTGTGNMDIDGLPYAVNVADAAPANIYVGGAVPLTAGNILSGYAAFGTSQIYLRQLPTGGGAGAAVPLDTNAQLFISGQYRV